jgi:thioredoxin reductase (NADPH)
VIEGAVTEENRQKGTLPLGQLALTTEVENYPGFPVANLGGYLDAAIDPKRKQYMAPHAGHGVSGPELMELMRQQAINFGTRILTDDVVSIELKRHPFRLKTLGGQVIEALAVIVATGARANYLGLPSEDRYKNNGVSACAVCDGALPRFRNKPLVVVGGGDSAMEEATFLTKFGSKVQIIHRRDEFRASKIMAERALKNPKIEVKWNSTIDEVLGDDKAGVTGVRIRGTDDKNRVEDFRPRVISPPSAHAEHRFFRRTAELTEKKYIRWTTAARLIRLWRGFCCGRRTIITAAITAVFSGHGGSRRRTLAGVSGFGNDRIVTR